MQEMQADVNLIPRSGRFPGGGLGNPLQYSCLENPIDRTAWRVLVHRIIKSQTQLKWLSTQACTDCHLPGSSIHGIFQARVLKWSEVAQSCPALCDPMDCSLPGSSIHGIFQARVLEWVAISFSRGSSRLRARTWVSHSVGRRFTVWATREADVAKLSWLLNPCDSVMGWAYRCPYTILCTLGYVSKYSKWTI